MPDSADLELTLRRVSIDAFAIQARYSQPDSDADQYLTSGGPCLVRFDFAGLRSLALDSRAYGTLLGQQLFGDANLRQGFALARSNARSLDAPLRLRLFIDPSAPELHALRWETLRDPSDDACLATSERVLFSRYLASGDWRRVQRRAPSELRALIVIASPSNLEEYGLTPIPVKEELQRATTALGTIPITSLPLDGHATLNQLTRGLRDGCDILYLLCHGALVDDKPYLYLEDEAGKCDIVDGRAVVERMNELDRPPRLVVLASCESAKPAAGDSPFTALGPLLAESGVATVVAMQDVITQQTIDKFMPKFFTELQKDGQIDRAMAVARGEVRERYDAWMPVLFMRLKSGALWSEPGFAGESMLEQWPSLVEHIHRNIDVTDHVSCTPILGSGLVDALFGSTREIARRWADSSGFPLAPHVREDLPQVAQYVAIMQGGDFPGIQMDNHLRDELLNRFKDQIPEDKRNASLETLMTVVGKYLRERDPAEPFQVLAQLPFPIYVTANPDQLLADALIAAGKEPRVEICPWNEQSAVQASVSDDRDYRPDVQHPLVYHLFGHLKEPDSLILTEDEYFDYLIGMTNNKARIPTVVLEALADSQLLFLGFQIDDWNFRVLLRSIMTRAGSAAMERHEHVAVQIDPEESRIADPRRARRYLERYFRKPHINVYWGSAQDFVRQVLPLWTERRQRDLFTSTGRRASSLSAADVARLLKPVTRTGPP